MKIVILLCICILGVTGQIDDTFCNIDNIVSDDGQKLPLPVHNITERFQVAVEQNSGKNKFTTEIQEFYDGTANIGISINTYEGLVVTTYSYYNTNELLLVNGDKCKVYNLNESYSLSPFFVLNLPDGSEHIVNGLTALILSNQIKYAYLGSKNRYVRGIPAKEWQACAYSQKDEATVKITISYSNETFWLPAVSTPGYQSVPLQVKIDFKTKANTYYTDYNVLTQFKPGLLIQEENYFTKPGVYCENRLTKKQLPAIPTSFSYIAHQAESDIDADNYKGELKVSRVEIDYDKKLSRFDYLVKGVRFTEIHDQNTDLRYLIDDFHRNCSVTLLDPNFPESHTPSEFFTFDKKPDFEYIGQRRIRGINTDAWIAPRKIAGLDATLEWHFMSDGWIVQETSAVKQNEPILLIITLDIKQDQTIKKKPIYYHVSNFDQTRIDYFDFDVSSCNNVRKEHIRFSITNDKYDVARTNQGLFKVGALESLMSVAKVNVIRISQLEAIFDNGTIYVSFTLLDKSSLGNADPISLKDASDNIRVAVLTNQLLISFYGTNNEKYGVTADPDSFVILDERSGRYVYNYIDNGKTVGYTGSSVAGFIIGFLLIGLFVGFIAGLFLILRRSTAISLPGPLSFFNPNFKSSSEA